MELSAFHWYLSIFLRWLPQMSFIKITLHLMDLLFLFLFIFHIDHVTQINYLYLRHYYHYKIQISRVHNKPVRVKWMHITPHRASEWSRKHDSTTIQFYSCIYVFGTIYLSTIIHEQTSVCLTLQSVVKKCN